LSGFLRFLTFFKIFILTFLHHNNNPYQEANVRDDDLRGGAQVFGWGK